VGLDRTHGGLQILAPFEGGSGDGFAGGNADAIAKQLRFIQRFAPDVVVTMSADHVYRLDLRDVLEAHRERDSAATIVTTALPDGDDPSRFAWVGTDGSGEVTMFEYKPDAPRGSAICTEVFAFDGPALQQQLSALSDDGPLGDYGDRLIPAILDGGATHEFRLDGYWRDVGTIGAYHDAHMELLGDDPPLRLDDPAWPMLTGSVVGGPAAVTPGAAVERSLLSPGARVAGSVSNSVLGRGVMVEAGASVRDSVVLDDAVVRRGATVERAIVDIGVVIDAEGAESSTATDEESGVAIVSARADRGDDS